MIPTKTDSMVSVRVPFDGFYNSIHEAIIDTCLESINQDDTGADLDEEIISSGNVMWAQVHLSYAQAYVRKVAEISGTPMIFEKIISPRDYATGNDVIIARVEIEVLEKSLEAQSPEVRAAWRTAVAEALTERPGFVPYSRYPKDAHDWGIPPGWDGAQRDLFFDFTVSQLLDQHAIAEGVSDLVDEFIWGSVIDPNLVPGHVDNKNELPAAEPEMN